MNSANEIMAQENEEESTTSFVQALLKTLPSLQHRVRVYNKVISEICQHQEQSSRITRYAMMLQEAQENPQNPSSRDLEEQVATCSDCSTTTSAASLYRWEDHTPNTREEHLQDVAVLESILPSVQNYHAKRLLLALKLKLEAEIDKKNQE